MRADPTAHAEMIALREAARSPRQLARRGQRRVRHARAVRDVRRGDRPGPGSARGVRGPGIPRRARPAASWNVLDEPQLNHRPQVEGGLLAEDCADLLQGVLRLASLSSAPSASSECSRDGPAACTQAPGRRTDNPRVFTRDSALSALLVRLCGIAENMPGEVAERLNAPVSKTGMGGFVHRGFESLPLR